MSASAGGSPRGFYFWSLAPFLVLYLVVMPFLVQPPTVGGVVVLWTIVLLVVLMLLGLFSPLRFWWAWRGVGFIVFLGYVAYLVAMLFEGKFAAARRGEPVVQKAVVGLFIFGVPGLWFALTGRLISHWRSRLNIDEEANEDDADNALQ
jgi:hypothetical protein